MIVAAPYAAAVTRPVEDTVATDALDELHDTLTPLIVALFWSLTVADSCCCSPDAEKLKLVADSVIEVATDVAGVVGIVLPSPHAASSSTDVNRMYRMLSIWAAAFYPRQRGDPTVPGTLPYSTAPTAEPPSTVLLVLSCGSEWGGAE